ncbi:right-handed parallel beta-helix repeat-containing protein [Methylobacterium sp. WL69]|uniref:right-handed parallel beta-helix repeat-containing protein n=1 Tax=Methylobacterium sp. WL69 TaxID=2603893 RepID=UPI001650041F|nr:right-handed parallel beta-helix repeat-containing protein [Methylobacterium sp. WL69]
MRHPGHGLSVASALLITSAALAFDSGRTGPDSLRDRQAPNVDVIMQRLGATGDGSDLSAIAEGGSVKRLNRTRWTDSQVQAVDYGVTCDGVANDAPAILAATNVAVGLGGRDVVFPSGTCLLKTGLLPPSRTRWVSRGGTIVTFDPNMTMVGTLKSAISFENVSDLLIEGIVFKGNGTATKPCGSVGAEACPGSPRVTFLGANGVTIRNSTFRDFGDYRKDAKGKALAYSQGIVAFGGADWLVENSRFIDNSGDGIAWSNATRRVEVRGSHFEGNDDSSGPVCTVGGSSFNIHDNQVVQRRGNTAPLIVMDRCTNWQINNNRIYGVANDRGHQTGQGIRVARYAIEASTHVSHDFTISGNVIIGTAAAISVENAGTVQPGYTDQQGKVQPAVNVLGGGRFAVTGNTSVGANTCISIVDSEIGAVSGNTCSNVRDAGLLLISYTTKTGSIAVGSNIFTGTNVAGSFGVRQIASGGAITPSAIAPQFAQGFATAYQIAPFNQPPIVPVVTRSATAACTPGEITVKADQTAIQVCTTSGSVRSAPLR